MNGKNFKTTSLHAYDVQMDLECRIMKRPDKDDLQTFYSATAC